MLFMLLKYVYGAPQLQYISHTAGTDGDSEHNMNPL